MSKFRALILTNGGPAIFDLGQQEDFDHAATFANEYCDRKNEENRKLVAEAREQATPEQREDIKDLDDVEVVWILDTNDYRRLAGTVAVPYVIAKKEQKVESVESPVRHGGEPAEEAVEE